MFQIGNLAYFKNQNRCFQKIKKLFQLCDRREPLMRDVLKRVSIKDIILVTLKTDTACLDYDIMKLIMLIMLIWSQ